MGPWVCKVKDRQGNRVMVEHADLDISYLALSIHENGKTRWVQHPNGKVANFSDALDENSITFDPADRKFLQVNGERFPIEDAEHD